MPRRSRAAFQSGMLVQRGQHHDRLFHLERRAHVAHDLPAVDHAPGHRHDHLHHVGLGALQEHDPHLAVDRHGLAGVDGAHHVLGGVEQADVGEAQGLVGHVGLAAGVDDLAGGDDLVPAVSGCAAGVQGGSGGRGGHARLMLCAAVTEHPLPSPHGGRRRPGGSTAPGNWPAASGRDHHDVLVLLGSGLSGAAEVLGAGEEAVPLDTLPFFPPYTAGGHRAQAWSVEHDGRRILVLGGRCHLYEGLTPAEVVHPLRTGIATGCRTVILTAAAGGIRDDLATGSVMVVEDHLNLTGRSPLIGPDFVDMADAYAPRLRALALRDAGTGRIGPGRPARRLRPAPGTPVRDPGRDPHAAHHGRRRRGHVDGPRDHRRPPGRRRGPRAGPGHQRGRRRPTPPSTWRPSPTSGPTAVPAVAAIVRHVVGSLA